MMALANSLGWMLMGPSCSQRWAPRALFPHQHDSQQHQDVEEVERPCQAFQHPVIKAHEEGPQHQVDGCETQLPQHEAVAFGPRDIGMGGAADEQDADGDQQ